MKKIPIWKNVVLIVSTLSVIVFATFAWFYTRPIADTDDLAVLVGEAGYIQISGDDGKNWSDDLNTEIGINKNFKEISGNGSDFYAPVYDVVENASGGFSTQLVSFSKVGENQGYYEQTMMLRADASKSVYLSSQSYVVSENASGDGYIDGAIRVAFFEIDESGNEILKYIWAPNSTVEYSAVTDSFTREGSVEPYYYYQKSMSSVDISVLQQSTDNVAMVSTEGTDELGCGYNQEYQFMWSNGQNLPENAPPLFTLDDYGEDQHYHKSIKIRVWLEGYDRECVSQLSGQKFTMKFQFTSQKGE